MGEFWDNPGSAATKDKERGKTMVYEAVNASSDAARAANMAQKPSTTTFTRIKEWGKNPKDYSFSTGEVDRLGQHVPERYLDDRTNLKGTRLKMLCRLGCLPLMDRVGREASPTWPKE